MKYRLVGSLVAALVGVAGASAAGPAPWPQVVHSWRVLSEERLLASAAGVGVSSSGEVLVFHRIGRLSPEPSPMAAFTPSVIAVIDGRPIKALAAEQLQGLRVLSGAEVVVADDGERALSGADLSSIAIVGGAGRRLQRIERSGSYDGELRLTHDVATDNLGRRYVFSTSNPRVQTVARGKWARRSAPRGSP